MKKTVLTISLLFFSLNFLAQNNYLDFDGVNDFVSVPNSGSLISGATAISMSCKVYPKNANPGWPDFDGFIGYRNDSNCDFYITQVSSTGVEARFRNSSGTAFNLTYNGMVLNQWNHFFLVYNGTTFKLYSGATEVAITSASGAMPASVTNLFQIGVSNYFSTSFYFNGYIDEVSLWNKALTAADITAINTNSGEIANPTTETQLKVYYKFNQGIAYGTNTGLTTLIDEKATQNGTLNNFNLSGTSSNWGSETLGTKQFSASVFKVYPNPVADVLNISGLEPIENIKIIDFMGRTITERKDSSNDFSVANLNSGVYFLIINQNQTVKFIKK